MTLPEPPLLVVTDRQAARRPLADVVELACEGGARWFLVRELDLESEALAALVKDLHERVARWRGRVLVSRNLEVARLVDGVHLSAAGDAATAREVLGPDALIGQSAHDAGEAARAMGCDYVTLSPVFPSISKPGHGPVEGGFEDLARIARSLPVPALALGGILPSRVAAARAAGFAGVAVCGSVMQADDVAETVRDLIRNF